MDELFDGALAEHLAVFESLPTLRAGIARSGRLLAGTLAAGHKIMLCGNGGSAADAQHIAAELSGRFVGERRALAGLALSTDTSALTCIANDYGFEAVFERQVQALGRPGDCLVAISTSGRSANVLRAAQAAKAQGLHTLALSGGDGGALRELCDEAIVVPSRRTARIQEAHIFIGHLWCAMIERELGLAA